MKIRYYILFILTGFLFYSCEPELEDYNYSSGTVDFSTYVALGNSLTAGYADGALYREVQETSYPSIIAQQLEKVGGGEFVQPLMEGEYGILPGKLELGYATDCLGETSLSPVPAQGTPEPPAHVGYKVHNLGIPGAKSFHLLATGYGDPAGVPAGLANPYYARFAVDPPNSYVLGDAMALNPTFFTIWIGNNDVLGYATSGGLGDTITGQQTFGFVMSNIITPLANAGAKGAIANIPDVSSIPFFNTVPPNGYVVTQEEADILNQALGQFGFTYQEGPNYFIIEDPTTQLGFRQMVEGELLLLTVPQDSLKCAFWGGFNPILQIPVAIPPQYVLTTGQLANIHNAIQGYNQTLKGLADQYDLAYVDVNTLLKDAEDEVVFDGETFSTEFITGNAFSLDGIHLTPKGYALVANHFIKAINEKYGSSIPLTSATNYRSNDLP